MFKLIFIFLISFNLFAQSESNLEALELIPYQASISALAENMDVIDWKTVKVNMSIDDYDANLKMIRTYVDSLVTKLSDCEVADRFEGNPNGDQLLANYKYQKKKYIDQTIHSLATSRKADGKKSVVVDMNEEEYLIYNLNNGIKDEVKNLQEQVAKCKGSVVHDNQEIKAEGLYLYGTGEKQSGSEPPPSQGNER